MGENLTTIAWNFLGLPADLSAFEDASAVVIPLPYDGTTTYRPGTRDGPAAILAASQAVEWFDPELGREPCQAGIATLDPLEPDARGPEHMLAAVRAHCRPAMQAGKFVVSLGGEHSLSLGCVQACLDAQPARADGQTETLSFLQIDAHADLRDSYHQTPYSHACVMRRLLELGPVVQVGIRSYSLEEHEFIEQRGLKPWTMERIRSNPDWIEQALAGLTRRVYLTIDLDGFDPSVCPGVGTPEPGGLGWQAVIDLCKALFARHEVVAADVVECLPLAGQVASEFLAARLVYKLIGLNDKHAPHV
jgi:agmatinase